MALDSNLNLGMNKYILHIETATKVCSVALSNCGEFIACKESISDGFIHSEALTLYIEEVLAEGKVTLSDLCAISISSGPGSYTGLRIGLSTAKGLCFALKIPLISVDTLSALMELVPPRNQNIIPLLDARRMEVYAQVFSSTGTILKAIDSIELDEKTFAEFEPFQVCGDGAWKCKEIWRDREIYWNDAIVSSARGQIQLAFHKFEGQQVEDLAYFTPIYLKDANGVRR